MDLGITEFIHLLSSIAEVESSILLSCFNDSKSKPHADRVNDYSEQTVKLSTGVSSHDEAGTDKIHWSSGRDSKQLLV